MCAAVPKFEISLGTQTPRKNGRGVWAPGLPECVSVHRDVGIRVIAIMTLYDVPAAQLFECWRWLAQWREQQRVYVVGQRRMMWQGRK